jgi:oxygen-dependent protoporphyrinogen oxidase
MTTRNVAVVGAGLAGLTAGYRLMQAGWAVDVFESEPEVGGRVKSVARDGYIIDTAAAAGGVAYAAYNAIAEELGLAEDIVLAAPYIGIVRGGRVHAISTDRFVWSALITRLISVPSKLRSIRMGVDIVRAANKGQLDYIDMRNRAPLDDEDSRSYAMRALNSELDQYLCEPFIRTLLLADTDRVSKVELFSGFANIFKTKLTTLRGGMSRFPKTLASALNVTVDAPVSRVSDLGDAVEIEYAVGDTAPCTRRYDAVVIAAPLPVAAKICPDRSQVLDPIAAHLRYTQAITVAVATSRAPRCPATMVQIPSREDPDVALLFLEHNKSPDRVPAPGRGLIDAHWEADASALWMDEPDQVIGKHTVTSLVRIFPELRGAVEFAHVTRWRQALPLTEPGIYRRIGEFNASLDRADRIQFAGDYMSSAGQNSAVAIGGKAARNLIKNLPA